MTVISRDVFFIDDFELSKDNSLILIKGCRIIDCKVGQSRYFNKDILILDTISRKEIAKLNLILSLIPSFEISDDNETVIIGSTDHSASVWKKSKEKITFE